MTDYESVRAWISDDPDPTTAAELAGLLEAAETGDGAAAAELADRFAGLLQFGTAGLRGELGGGPARMNRAVVIRAAAGLMAHLQEIVGLGASPRVVIGYDARVNSAVFARDTAAAVTAAGGQALLFDSTCPTPVLAFATNRLDADAGVMVTASHNPARDNGYKVYVGGRIVSGPGRGVQIVPPHDKLIATRIAQVSAVADVPRATGGWTMLDESLTSQYVSAVVAAAPPGPRDLRIVLTSMHGVGGPTAAAVLQGAGFTDLHVVAEQAQPDPTFPTVPFPNPEEAGAIDLAVALAKQVQADLVLAHDPDADRCAAAVFDPYLGDWRMLHGDEIGSLLGLKVAREVGKHPHDHTREGVPTPVLANSIVSSRLLGRIAAAAGLAHTETLTGFKWIARVPGLVFGYEEAIGYCAAPTIVRDKDGISAGLALAALAAEVKAHGSTLIDLLDDLAREHGLYLTDQVSLRFADVSKIGATMAQVRQAPPTELAGSPLVQVADLAQGVGGLPPTDGIRLLAQDGSRVIIRPSGTEPKVKCYLEIIQEVGTDMAQTRRQARERLAGLAAQIREYLGA